MRSLGQEQRSQIYKNECGGGGEWGRKEKQCVGGKRWSGLQESRENSQEIGSRKTKTLLCHPSISRFELIS